MNTEQINQMIKDMYQEFTVKEDGSLTCTIRGGARIVGVKDSGLVKSFKSAAQQIPKKLAKFLMNNGFESASIIGFSDNGIPDTALALILEYFAYETQERYRTEQAKLFCRAYRAVGLRTHVKEVLGLNLPTTQYQLPQSYSEALRQLADKCDENEDLKDKNSKLSANLLLSESTIDEQKEDLETYSALLDKPSHLDGKQLADALQINNFGRNKLYEFLRNIGFLCQTNTNPRFDKINKGYCGVSTKSYQDNNDNFKVSQKPIFYFEGVKYIIKKLKKENYNIPNHVTAEQIWEDYNLNFDNENIA